MYELMIDILKKYAQENVDQTINYYKERYNMTPEEFASIMAPNGNFVDGVSYGYYKESKYILEILKCP